MDIAHEQTTFLTFRVGSMLCCAPMAPVVSIIDNASHYRLPSTQGSHAMMVRYESEVAGLIDLHHKLGLPQPKHNTETCLIIVRLHGELLALWADEALDILKPPHNQRWAGGEPATWFPNSPFDRVLVVKDKMVLHTDFEKLVAMKNVPPNWAAAQRNKQAAETEPAINETTTSTLPEKTKPVHEEQVPTAPITPQRATDAGDDTRTTQAVTTNNDAPETKRPPSQAVERLIAPRKASNSAATRPRSATVIPHPRATQQQTAPRRHRAPAARNTELANSQALRGQGWNRYSMPAILLLALLCLLAGGGYSYYSLQQKTSLTPAPVVTAGTITQDRAPTQATAAVQLELEDVTIIVEPAEQIGKKTVPAEASTTPGSRMTHIVVAGDTLWDIAEHYLGNPYRYPNLARYSGIRNPNLIHPGDRVHIIRKQR